MFNLLEHTGGLSQQSRKSGDVVFSRGEETGGLLGIVLEGEVAETRKSDGAQTTLKLLPAGRIFGEIEVMAEAPKRLRTFVVKSPTARIAFMDKERAIKLGSLYPEFFLILLKRSIDELHEAEQELLK